MGDLHDGLFTRSDDRGRLPSAAADARDWLLLEFDRYAFSLLLALVGFAMFVWLEVAGVVRPGEGTTPLLYLFQALVAGNVTLITIVVSINQLILSRELRSPRELQEEVSSAEAYREEVEERASLAEVPEEPSDFLRLLLREARQPVDELDAARYEADAPDLADDLDEMVRNLEGELDAATDRLDRSKPGLFPTLLAILDSDFVSTLNHSRSIRRSHEITGTTQNLLEAIEQSVERIDIARQYFKTIYIKQELASVSKLVIYTGFVATIVALGALVVTGYHSVPNTWWARRLLVPAAVAVNLFPISLLITHVLRISTVAKRTAAITPFIAPSG